MSETARRHLHLLDLHRTGAISPAGHRLSLARLENLQRALLTEGTPSPAPTPLTQLFATAVPAAAQTEADILALLQEAPRD